MNRFYNQSRPAWGASFVGTTVGRLVLINVVVFIVQQLFPPMIRVFGLWPRLVVEDLFVWQLFSYMFLHGNFMHLFFNMLMLWLLGSTIEAVWGGKHFLRYYIVCGLGGAVASLFFNYNSVVVGASGAIFGLYLAYAMMFPENYVLLYFVVPVKAKYLVAGLAILQLANGVAGGSGVAYFAHLGGMAAGLIFFRTEVLQRMRFSFGARRKWRAYMSDQQQQQPPRQQGQAPEDNDNIDSILDKISAKGYDKLSTTEKRILENYSRKRKEESE